MERATMQGDIGMHSTIDYYNLNAKNFIENTQNVDMHLAQDISLTVR